MSLDIIVNTKDLVKILALSASIVEKRNVLAILSNVKLEAKDNILTITATDMELSVQQILSVQVREEGAITVPAQTFSEIIRKISDPEISLTFVEDKEQLYISSQNCQFSLFTLPVNEFPIMEDIGLFKEISLDAKSFLEILDHTKFAMSNEETRYNLNGIYLHIHAANDKALCAAATDVHRLSISQIDLEKSPGAFGIILPRKTVQELLKILKDSNFSDKDLKIQIGQSKVKFLCHHTTLISKLIDGSFPEYEAFIPVDNPYTLVVKADVLSAAIDRISTVTIDKFRAVKIVCDKDKLEIHAYGDNRGIGDEVILMDDITSYNGEEICIGFNPRYILDALNVLGNSMVSIELNNSSSPTLIRSLDHPGAKFVIMPIKV